MSVNDGGPAFPQTHDSWSGCVAPAPPAPSGMSLRDYFAAHAPVEPWRHFKPTVGPQPKSPELDVLSYEDAARTLSLEHQRYVTDLARNWQKDPCFDLETYPPPDSCAPFYAEALAAGRSALIAYERAWRTYWNDNAEWDRAYAAARVRQWPWFYADAMVAERGRES